MSIKDSICPTLSLCTLHFCSSTKRPARKKRTKLPLEFQLGSQQWALSSEWVSCFFKKTTQCETEPTLGSHTTRCVAEHIRDSSESPFKFCLGFSAGVGIPVLSIRFFFYSHCVIKGNNQSFLVQMIWKKKRH